MFNLMSTAVSRREPRLAPRPAAPSASLAAPLEGRRAPAPGRESVGWNPTGVSLLVHALLVLLIVIGLPEWLLRRHEAPPPVIEVALVLPPPPAPEVKPSPKPPPEVPRSSDASSKGRARPTPAENAEAAPTAREPGPSAAPPRKADVSSPAPAAKPSAAEVRHAPVPPAPRSIITVPQTAPAAASPTPAPPSEHHMASVAPEPAPTPRGADTPAPRTGKAPQTGFGVVVPDPPGGIDPAVFDPYLASVRDKIMTKRELLRTFQYSREAVVLWLVLDDKGRLSDFGVAESSGSPTFEHYAKNMLALAPYFGPPPPGISGRRLYFYLIIPDNQADWDELMATGKPPRGAG